LIKINPFPLGLKEILEDQAIIKIFHDFCEDTSALVKQFGVHCERVFDTQIAHRMCNKSSSDPKDMNINLNSLLQQYMSVQNKQKDSIVSQMNEDPELWWKVSPRNMPLNMLS
jgi:ribonuclease D